MDKTIFISAFNPFILRNVLIGGSLKELSRNLSKIVILVPEYKKDFFQKEIGNNQVIIQGVQAGQISRQDTIFRFINSSLVPSQTLLLHKKEQLAKGGRKLRFWVSFILMRVIRLIPGMIKLSQLSDYLTMRKDYYHHLFERYRPLLIFAADVFNDDDVHLLVEAKKNNIKTIGMVRSWDNFTTKGVLRIEPDFLIVQNEIIKKEANQFSRVPSAKIFVSGFPHYDRYLVGERLPRDKFFQKIGLDPNRKLILLAPAGQRFTDTDWEIMDILKKFIKDKEIPDAGVLIRNTPNDFVPLGSFKPDEHFYLDDPGHFFGDNVYRDRELGRADMEWLADCLYHADVVVSAGASIGIDAAIFGKPTIIIHFDGYGIKPYHLSMRRCVEYNHPAPLLKSGALRSAQSQEQLLEYLRGYLEDPKKDETARGAMLRDYCWKLDGRAGQRIGQFISRQVDEIIERAAW